jgi:hypothetical protein
MPNLVFICVDERKLGIILEEKKNCINNFIISLFICMRSPLISYLTKHYIHNNNNYLINFEIINK